MPVMTGMLCVFSFPICGLGVSVRAACLVGHTRLHDFNNHSGFWTQQVLSPMAWFILALMAWFILASMVVFFFGAKDETTTIVTISGRTS